MEHFEFSPVGVVRTTVRYRGEAPRQAAFSSVPARVELLHDEALRIAAADLTGFERIWIVGVFHLNAGSPWKPKVRPPVSPDNGRYGVFATRSPHRPNPIALSCVKLLAVHDFTLEIDGTDLIDGTPVLDIKPYIPEADAFPDAAAGWRDRVDVIPPRRVSITPAVGAKMAWIKENSGLDLENFCQVQLTRTPFDSARRRLFEVDEASGTAVVGCRTWRVRFRAAPESGLLELLDVFGGYRPSELAANAPDPYGDKELHRAFLRVFSNFEA